MHHSEFQADGGLDAVAVRDPIHRRPTLPRAVHAAVGEAEQVQLHGTVR